MFYAYNSLREMARRLVTSWRTTQMVYDYRLWQLVLTGMTPEEVEDQLQLESDLEIARMRTEEAEEVFEAL